MTDRSNTAAVLTAFATRINAAHEAAERGMSEGMRHALDAGRLLIEARSAVAHGQWLPWLKANVSFAERTAQAYMRMAKRVENLEPAEAQRVADLSFREALAEAAKPRAAPVPKEDPENYCTAFLLRADQAVRFAAYSGEVTPEIIALARQVEKAWEKLVQQMELA